MKFKEKSNGGIFQEILAIIRLLLVILKKNVENSIVDSYNLKFTSTGVTGKMPATAC
jgi:hypothetical protein